MDQVLNQFLHHVETSPHKAGISENALTLSLAKFNAASDAVAWTMKEHGIAAHSVVAYLGGPGIARFVTLLGCAKAAVTFVALDRTSPPAALAEIAEHADIVGVFVEDDTVRPVAETFGVPVIPLPSPWPASDAIEPFKPVASPDDAISIMRYTSGSTGKPKGILVTRAALQHQAKLCAHHMEITADDRMAFFAQMWPNMYFGTLYSGASIECYDPHNEGPGELVEWLRERRISQIICFPAIFRSIPLHADNLLPDIRVIQLTGEALLRADVERFDKITVPGAQLCNFYGSSEFPYAARHTHRNGDQVSFSSVPLGGFFEPDQVKLLDENGEEPLPGEIGEIVVLSPYLPLGYHKDPERTAQVFRHFPKTGRKAYFSGDRAFVGVDGLLHPAGRADEQIKVRGYTIRPSDIEQAVLDVPGINRAAVVAFEGPQGIKRLACHYETESDPGPSPAEIRAHLSVRVPAYMVPGAYMRHDLMPRTTSGKIQRKALPNPLEALAASQRGVEAAESATERGLASIWRDILGHAEFGRDEDFFDIGGDSLQAMAVLVAAEERFGIRVPLESLIVHGATLSGLAARIDQIRQQGAAAEPVALNSPGLEAPLFAVHVFGGHLSNYLELAHVFSGRRPVLGLGARGLDGRSLPDSSVEAIAHHAVEMLRRHRRHRPLTLVGFSSGGIYAFEMARQIALADDPPPNLILFDCSCPWLDNLRWLRSTWRAVKKGDLGSSGVRMVSGLATSVGREVKTTDIDEAHLQAVLNYEPEPVELPRAILFTAETGLTGDKEQAEWQRLLGDSLDVVTMPGDHMSMIRAPHVGALARHIDAWLADNAAAATVSL